MLIDPAPKFRKRKPRGGRPAVVPPGPAPLVVTGVNDVEYDGAYAAMTLYLDVADGHALLEPVDADPAKWSTRLGGTIYTGTSVSLAADNALRITFADFGGEAGPNVVSYAADPSDIGDDEGRMLAAFADVPL